MTKQELKDSVALIVKTNGNREISGANLQAKLFEIIDECYNVGGTIPATQVTTDSSNRFVTDTQLTNFQSGYNNAILLNGGATVAVTFATSKYYGSVASPVSGAAVTYDFTNAVAGSKAIIFHNAGSEPTYPVGTYKRFGLYQSSQLNILTFEYIDSNTILLDIAYSTAAGLQPEVAIWIAKGGVATGFILNKLNQFLIDITSIRSKIIRLNPIVSETFVGAFVPLICGTNNITVIGNPLDTNVNFIPNNYQLLGTFGGFISGATKYIDTSIIPNNTTDFGQNDCSIGVYGLNGDNVFQGDGTINIGGGGGYNRLNNTTGDFVSSSATRSLCTLSRVSSTGYNVYINGLKTSITRTSTGRSTSTLKYGFPSSVTYGNTLVGGYFIAKGLNDAEELIIRTAWSNLMTGLVRNT